MIIDYGQFKNIGEYRIFAQNNGLISDDGTYFLLIRIGASSNSKAALVGFTLCRINENAEGFTTRKAAEDYMKKMKRFEPALRMFGGFIVKKVPN